MTITQAIRESDPDVDGLGKQDARAALEQIYGIAGGSGLTWRDFERGRHVLGRGRREQLIEQAEARGVDLDLDRLCGKAGAMRLEWSLQDARIAEQYAEQGRIDETADRLHDVIRRAQQRRDTRGLERLLARALEG